jgi:S1-C subfamily serine protease
MKYKTALLVFSMMILACCTKIEVIQEQGWEGVASKVLDSTVFFESRAEVFNPESGQTGEVMFTGSGVIISEDGWIVTSAHILNRDGGLIKNVTVILSNRTTFIPEQVFLYPAADLAIVKIKTNGLPFVKIRTIPIQIGEACLSSGSPYPLQFVVNEGIVSQLGFLPYIPSPKYMNKGIISFIGYLVHTATITQGNSGGAVVDKEGNLLGINAGAVEDGPVSRAHLYAFAVHIDDIMEKLDDVSVRIGHKIYTASLNI